MLGWKLDVGGTVRHLKMELPAALTGALLTSIPAAWHAEVNDVLLTALAIAVCAWRETRGEKRRPVLLDLEGHGRETGEFGIDISQTVGWFTTIFPVALDPGELSLEDVMSGGPDAGNAIRSIKEQLRAIPGRGLGYGLLRYMNPVSGPRLAAWPDPQMAFNYLGRFSSSHGDWSAVDEDSFSAGINPSAPLAHLLEINAATMDGREGATMIANWSWAPRHLREEDVTILATSWRRALEGLARNLARPGAGGFTPSDFPLLALRQEQVEALEKACPELEQVLPLSPLQEGLLFHSLYDRSGPDVYQVQICLEFEGPLERGRMRSAMRDLLRRHANLRIAIRHHGFEQPVQVVLRTVELPWREEDLSGMDEDEKSRQREKLLAADRSPRFDFSAAPPF